MKPAVDKVVVLTHGDPKVAAEPLRQALAILRGRGVLALAPPAEWAKHGEILAGAGGVLVAAEAGDLRGVGLCLVLGGDGTMLRAFQLTRDLNIPVAGVNLGRVGFLTTVPSDALSDGLTRLLAGDFTLHPLLGLRARLDSNEYRATNDVVVSKGDRSHASELRLTINGVTMFEVLCDGVVVATPAGSSAYSLAAGGPLLGISLDAYVISLLAPHAVGVRPVVAAPGDILEITNLSPDADCFMDIDGQRLRSVPPGATIRIQTEPADTTLALLSGDSLYHHFRDRLL